MQATAQVDLRRDVGAGWVSELWLLQVAPGKRESSLGPSRLLRPQSIFKSSLCRKLLYPPPFTVPSLINIPPFFFGLRMGLLPDSPQDL